MEPFGGEIEPKETPKKTSRSDVDDDDVGRRVGVEARRVERMASIVEARDEEDDDEENYDDTEDDEDDEDEEETDEETYEEEETE